jgi:hypothetical protein
MDERKALKNRINELKEKRLFLLANEKISDKEFFNSLRDLATLNQIEDAIRKKEGT